MQAPKQGVGTQRILLGGVGGVSPGAQPIGTCGVVWALAGGFAVCGSFQLKVGLRMSCKKGSTAPMVRSTKLAPHRNAKRIGEKNPRKICEGMIFVNKTSSLFDKFVKQSRRNTRIGA